MRSGRTKTIGLVIIADLTSAFFARATKSIVAEARSNGLSVLIVNTDEDPTSEREAVETLLEKQVDGLVVVVSSASEHPHLESQNLRRTPVILLDRSIAQLDLTSVTTDDFNGARMAVEYALSLGHRRLGFAAIVGPGKAVPSGKPSGLISTTQQRIDGFISAALSAGIPESELFWSFCGATIEETEQGVGRLLDAVESPTIFIAANNDIALGIITCATARNMVIGQDLSLIMFDDSPWAAVSPGVTVVARPVDELGSIAVTQLLAEIAGEGKPHTQIVLPTSLIIRGSVADLCASTEKSPLVSPSNSTRRRGNEPNKRLSLDQLIDRARCLASRGQRTILGITGAPGAGKSSLSEVLERELADVASIVPMDGFHLSNKVLIDLHLRDRKGAPHTFDVAGYIALLKRLRHQDEEIVYAPKFYRDIEEPIAAAIPILRTTPLVITEGNYLLLGDDRWSHVREFLDETWYIALNDSVRVERLMKRHVKFGKSLPEAEKWVRRSDEINAHLVSETAQFADLTIEIV